MFYNYIQRISGYTVYKGSKLLKKTPIPLKKFSSKTIIHEVAEEGYYPPPVTIDGQLERATGNFWRPLAEVIKNAVETRPTHCATKLFRLDSVTIDNGFFYIGSKAVTCPYQVIHLLS